MKYVKSYKVFESTEYNKSQEVNEANIFGNVWNKIKNLFARGVDRTTLDLWNKNGLPTYGEIYELSSNEYSVYNPPFGQNPWDKKITLSDIPADKVREVSSPVDFLLLTGSYFQDGELVYNLDRLAIAKVSKNFPKVFDLSKHPSQMSLLNLKVPNYQGHPEMTDNDKLLSKGLQHIDFEFSGSTINTETTLWSMLEQDWIAYKEESNIYAPFSDVESGEMKMGHQYASGGMGNVMPAEFKSEEEKQKEFDKFKSILSFRPRIITLGEWLDMYNSSPQKNNDLMRLGEVWKNEPNTDMSLAKTEEPAMMEKRRYKK
jgi:hypothetical protein